MSRSWSLPCLALLAACSGPPQSAAVETLRPALCRLMADHPGWPEAVRASSDRWGVPAPLILAFIRQESNFQIAARAHPPRGSYGYAQAVAGTWAHYQRDADRPAAARTNFADSVDFVGWYVSATQDRTTLPYSRTAAHYLAYSRGHAAAGAPSQAAVRNAARVAGYAASYDKDLTACPLPASDRSEMAALGG